MSHAVRGNMTRAILLAGDRDFTPLVETLVQFGLTVEVAGDFRSTSDVLAQAADVYRPLGISAYANFVEPNVAKKLPALPVFHGGPATAPYSPVAKGSIGKYEARVLPRQTVGFAIELKDKLTSRVVVAEGVQDLARACTYFRLEYGEIPWLEAFAKSLSPS